MPTRARSKPSRGLTWLAAAGVALAGAVWLFPVLIERLAIAALEGRGLSPATLSVETLTPWRLVIRNLEAGTQFKLKEFSAEFDPFELLDRRIRRIVIAEPFVNLDAFRTNAVAEGESEASRTTQSRLHIDQFSVQSGTGTYATPQGVLSLVYSADLTMAIEGPLSGTLVVSAHGPGIAAELDWRGSVPLDNPLRWRGNASLAATLERAVLIDAGREISGRIAGAVSGDDNGIAVDLSGDITDGHSRATGIVRGQMAAAADGSVGQDFDFPVIELAIARLPFGGADIDATVSLTENKGPIAVAGGKFEIDAQAAGTASSAPVNSASLAARGEWRLDGLSVSFDVADVAIKANDVRSADGSRLIDAVSLGLAPRIDPPPQVNLVFGSGGSVSIAPTLELAAGAFRLLPDGFALHVNPMPLDVAGYFALGDGGSRLSIRSGLVGALQTSSLVTTTGSRIKVETQLASVSDRPIGRIEAEFGGDRPWHVALNSPDLNFGPSGLAWSEAFGPLLDLRSVEGRLALNAALTPDGERINGVAGIVFDSFSFDWSETRFDGLTAELSLDQLWPPRSPGRQTLTLGKINAAVPIENGTIAFSFPGDGTLRIEDIALQFAGGSIDGETSIIHLNGAPSEIPLEVGNVKLGELLKSTTLDGLDGTGAIAGRLPLLLSDGQLLVRNGSLSANNGVIRYRPTAPSPALAAGGAIVGQALANFQYEELRADLNGDLMSDLKIGVHLKGKNPDLMKSYPVEFNLNLEGPIGQIATSSLSTYRIPKTIKNRIDLGSASGAAPTNSPQ
ncbi:MAG: hypothetical protein FJX59_17870 [Alphaproteobacteria bacterium]|nr:hypothetical protein [Alphaproteobacteria bacterium]